MLNIGLGQSLESYGIIETSDELYPSSGDESRSISGHSMLLQDILGGMKIGQERPSFLQAARSPSSLPQGPATDVNYETLFGEPDLPENIVFDSEGKLVAASKIKLVESLTTIIDRDFLEDFLLSFRSFMNARELSLLLSFRLQQGFFLSHSSLNDDEHAPSFACKNTRFNSQCIKIRTFVVLRQWIHEFYKVDFADNAVKEPIFKAISSIGKGNLNLTISDHQILQKLIKLLTIKDPDEFAIGEHVTTNANSNGNKMIKERLQRANESLESLPSVKNALKVNENNGGVSWTRKLGATLRNLLRFDTNEYVETGAMETMTTVSTLTSASASVSTLTASSASTITISSLNKKASLEEKDLNNTKSTRFWPWFSKDLKTKYTSRSCLTGVASSDMAEIFCLIESKVFYSISWTELLFYPSSCLTEGSNDDQFPNLKQSIDHFNRACQWVIEEIQKSSESPSTQATTIGKLIKLALKCLGLSNFNTLLQIVLALQSPAIEGLSNTWKRVDQTEKDIFIDLVMFCSPVKNFRHVRKAMERSELCGEAFCIPFTGLYLADLSANNERVSSAENKQDNSPELISWFKHQISAKIIRQFKSFQSCNRRRPSLPTGIKLDLYKYLEDSIEKTPL